MCCRFIQSVWRALFSPRPKRVPAWAAFQAAHLAQEPKCAACEATNKLVAHHIIPVTVNPKRELDPTNLITLCSRCHLVFGHLMCADCYNPDVRKMTEEYRAKFRKRNCLYTFEKHG